MRLRDLRVVGPSILVIAAFLTLVVALVIGSGAAPRLTSDPGAVVRWGLPAAKLIVNLASAMMLGSVVLAVYALRAGKKEFDIALDAASIGAAVLTISAGLTGFLTFLSSFNPAVSAGPEFGGLLGRFLLETELGRVWLITTVAAAVITLLAYAFRGWSAALVIGVLAVVAMVPMATQGHAGSLANHDAAVMALVLHVIGAAVWLGGLLTLVLLRPILREHLMRTVVYRYSTLALVAFIVVIVSGIARSLTSIGGVQDLLSPYGAVLALKVAALVGLGALGAAHRWRFIRRDVGERGVFWRFVAIEFAVMGLASGAAAALARTPSPADNLAPVLTTPAEIRTEAPLPPELTWARWLTSGELDLLWVVLACFGLFFYLAGVWRILRRGEAWSAGRTTAWIGGLALLAWTTSGPISAYGDYLHSVDALGRVLLVSIVPLLLVLGAPYRLALSAIVSRTDSSRGVREWLQAGAQSPLARFFSQPVPAACLFAAVLWATSATGVLRWTLSDLMAHQLRIGVLVLAGCVLMRALLRAQPRRRAEMIVAITAAVLLPVGLGAWVRLQDGLIAADWFGAMGRTWGLDPMSDQRMAGVILIAAMVPIVITVIGLRPADRTRKKVRIRSRQSAAD